MKFRLLVLLSASVVEVTGADMDPISLDDIMEAKSARLMKNKEDIDVQSTYHEDEIKGTGDASDEFAARLVKNRGPITAKITASGSHSRYCDKRGGEGNSNGGDCTVHFSLVAWKFAGDEGTIHGTMEEQFEDGAGLKVDVDCMIRSNNEAILGGAVKEANERHPVGEGSGRRAYVKVADQGSSGMDIISNIYFDDGIDSHCSNPSMGTEFAMHPLLGARVSVCSKHGDWEKCLEKSKMNQATVQ